MLRMPKYRPLQGKLSKLERKRDNRNKGGVRNIGAPEDTGRANVGQKGKNRSLKLPSIAENDENDWPDQNDEEMRDAGVNWAPRELYLRKVFCGGGMMQSRLAYAASQNR